MNKPTNTPERAHAINGVAGRMLPLVPGTKYPHLLAAQKWVSAARPVKGYGKAGRMHVKIRFDDECRNGHQTFSITADVYTDESRARHDIAAGGCMHDEIARVFPELAPLIKWHLTSTDGPSGYIANTVYFAGDRDCWGLRAGEKRQIKNGRTGLPAWHLVALKPDGTEVQLYELTKSIDATEQPACEYTLAYMPWCQIGEGKAREFANARNAAVWPDATDEELSAPPEQLRAALEARLPAVTAEFRAAMDAAGLQWF